MALTRTREVGGLAMVVLTIPTLTKVTLVCVCPWLHVLGCDCFLKILETLHFVNKMLTK